jgi:hypothetical protein
VKWNGADPYSLGELVIPGCEEDRKQKKTDDDMAHTGGVAKVLAKLEKSG